jgi:hypothetical protein
MQMVRKERPVLHTVTGGRRFPPKHTECFLSFKHSIVEKSYCNNLKDELYDSHLYMQYFA